MGEDKVKKNGEAHCWLLADIKGDFTPSSKKANLIQQLLAKVYDSAISSCRLFWLFRKLCLCLWLCLGSGTATAGGTSHQCSSSSRSASKTSLIRFPFHLGSRLTLFSVQRSLPIPRKKNFIRSAAVSVSLSLSLSVISCSSTSN